MLNFELIQKCMPYYNGKPICEDPRDTKAVSLLDAFGHIRYILACLPNSIDVVTEDSISITCYPGVNHWLSVQVDINGEFGTVKAEKEIIIFSGDRDIMRSLLEYFFFLCRDKVENPASKMCPPDPQKPSWLPSLLLFKQGIELFHDTDRMILGFYGIDSNMLQVLRELRRLDYMSWLNQIVPLNAWWFESPGKTFPDLMREFGLIKTV